MLELDDSSNSGERRSRLRVQCHRARDLDREPAAASRGKPDRRTFLFETTPQEQQAALQVVLPLRQIQRLVEPQFAIREFLPTGGLADAQQAPEDLRRKPSNQVLAINQDALVTAVVDEFVFVFIVIPG